MTTEPPIGRGALVTGSARRVGRHVAAALIARGWRVVVHATDANAAREAAVELGAASSIGGDLRDATTYTAIIDGAVVALDDGRGGGLDLLVNNASTFVHRPLSETTIDDWHAAFDVNARAPFFLSIAAEPHLRARRGSIVNISDMAAHEHWPAFAAHGASKAALEALTLSMAARLAPDVRVNAIAAGTILPPDGSSREELARLAGLPGGLKTPDVVVNALVTLVNDQARYGEVVFV